MMIKGIWQQFNQSAILKKISAAFILKVIGTLAVFVLYLIISRQYGAETMGSYSLFMALLSLFGIFSTLGLTSAVMRFVPDYISNNKFHELKRFTLISLQLSLALSFSLGLILFVFAGPLSELAFNNLNNAWILELVSILLPFYSLHLIGNEIARATGKTTSFEYFRSIHVQLIGLLVLLSMMWTFESNKLPIYITAALYVVAFLALLWLNLRYLIRHLNQSESEPESEAESEQELTVKKTLSVSFPMLLTSFSVVIMERIDTLMISYFYDNSEVGIYNVALKLSVLILFLIIPVNAVLIPKISAALWQKDEKLLALYVTKAAKFMFYSSLLVFTILAIFSKQFLGLFGTEFYLAQNAMIFLCVGYLFNAFHGLAEHLLNISGNEKKLTRIFTLGLVINIVLNYFLIPVYGINGAAFATMCSMIIWNVLAGFAVKKQLGLQILYIPFNKKLYST